MREEVIALNGKQFTIATVFAVVLLTVVFIPISSQQLGTYDPWLDINDDGKIDIKDLATVAKAYGTLGTPINKTALLLELQARLDALNATVTSLLESTQQVYADLFEDSTDGAALLRIDYPVGMFTKPPNLSVTAWFSSGSIAQMAHVTIVENTKDNCTIYLRDGDELPLSSHAVQISYVAVENKTIGTGTTGTKHYASTETMITTGNEITITFPAGLFTDPPHLSVVAFVQTGTDAGKTCLIKSMSVYTTHATLSLQAWSGAMYQDIGDGETVQVSYTACE